MIDLLAHRLVGKIYNIVANAVLVFFDGLLYQVKKQKLYAFPTGWCARRSIMMM
jgi:hypothetical protein